MKHAFRYLLPSLRIIIPRFSPAPSRFIRSAPRQFFATFSGRMESTTTNDADSSGYGVEYMPLEGVERLERYRPGGYHPIVIGDHLHGRYRIVHKLGFGTYSTTWLAKDQNNGSYVAIKIAVADSDLREADILRVLQDARPTCEEASGKAAIPSVLDEFDLDGPNGKHRCLVTAPANVSLADAKDASVSRLFQPSVARAIVAQLVQAIAFLHSQGIVHADLHLGNILLRLTESIDGLSPDQFYQKYQKPTLEPVQPSDRLTLSEARILLTDFGESFMPFTTKRYYSNTPDLLVPPELHFRTQEPLSFHTDIWALGCAIWSIVGQRPIFEAFNPSADWMTKEHVDVLGKLPPEWWEHWSARPKWFDEQGSRIAGAAGKPWAEWFESCVQRPRREFRMEEFSEDEKVALFALLRSMLAFRPSERPDAEQILQSDWITTWALPELESIRSTSLS
ncbi:protein kinase [Lineolata rhizophorae]|uniref:Protein kinase n=1 Tax=Lineolata rhizophorae TaxID=578093 RepID=A0A6A6NXH8_9PEZI|nr:protein kinase [Lineolata rhizophorae]